MGSGLGNRVNWSFVSNGKVPLLASHESTSDVQPKAEPVSPNLASVASDLVDAFLNEVPKDECVYSEFNPKDFESGRTILKADRKLQLEILLVASDRNSALTGELERWGTAAYRPETSARHYAFRGLAGALLRRSLPWSNEKLARVFSCTLGQGSCWQVAPMNALLRTVESFQKEQPLSGELIRELVLIKNAHRPRGRHYDSTENFKIVSRIERILAGREGSESAPSIKAADPWSALLAEQVGRLEPDFRSAWHPLWTHFESAKNPKASKKFLDTADSLISRFGRDEFMAFVLPLLECVGTAGPERLRQVWTGLAEPTMVHFEHADALRGLIWACSLISDEMVTHAIGSAAERCFRKVPNIGARAPKIGNACVWTLSQTRGTAAVAQLSRLKSRVKNASARAQIGKALEASAVLNGVTMDDLEEMAVPTFGMTQVGILERQIGSYGGVLRILGPTKTELKWLTEAGKRQSSMPSALKSKDLPAVKELKATNKQIRQLLPTQRDRIERFMLSPRSWPLALWRQRYLDHPLIGVVVRRLIWRFERDGRSFIWHDGQLESARGESLGPIDDDAFIQIWHPVDSDVANIEAWREWLVQHEVTQPFKQAHREIYLLTDAERNTATYSNRFAAHVLRQHQFASLCQTRGWKYSLQGAWDCDSTPTLELPEHGLRVEYWVETNGSDETTGAGIFLHLSTDQLRFYNPREEGPMALADVPPRILSEVMRDVDLFTGVASVGNDPNWSDGGPDGRLQAYWQNFSFGELSASAKTRRQTLERLLPRLKIASQCQLDDKFLIVRGAIRTYKIHLGSGNILMTPNDQYLCIVPDSRSIDKTGERVYLPFEGDRTMAIILSKAFMLAEDRKITDRTIITQLNGPTR